MNGYHLLKYEGWYQCEDCLDWKPLTEFGVDTGRPNGHSVSCYECRAAEEKLRRLLDPEAYYAKRRQAPSYIGNRSRKPPELGRFELYHKEGGLCYLRITPGCRAAEGQMRLSWVFQGGMANARSVVIEHVVALSDGGSNAAGNLRGACQECNLAKERTRRRNLRRNAGSV